MISNCNIYNKKRTSHLVNWKNLENQSDILEHLMPKSYIEKYFRLKDKLADPQT